MLPPSSGSSSEKALVGDAERKVKQVALRGYQRRRRHLFPKGTGSTFLERQAVTTRVQKEHAQAAGEVLQLRGREGDRPVDGRQARPAKTHDGGKVAGGLVAQVPRVQQDGRPLSAQGMAQPQRLATSLPEPLSTASPVGDEVAARDRVATAVTIRDGLPHPPLVDGLPQAFGGFAPSSLRLAATCPRRHPPLDHPAGTRGHAAWPRRPGRTTRTALARAPPVWAAPRWRISSTRRSLRTT